MIFEQLEDWVLAFHLQRSTDVEILDLHGIQHDKLFEKEIGPHIDSEVFDVRKVEIFDNKTAECACLFLGSCDETMNNLFCEAVGAQI